MTLNCLITGVLVCVCVEGDRKGGKDDEDNVGMSHQQAVNNFATNNLTPLVPT